MVRPDRASPSGGSAEDPPLSLAGDHPAIRALIGFGVALAAAMALWAIAQMVP